MSSYQGNFSFGGCGGPVRTEIWGCEALERVYLELVYLVTAFVPSETACLANSPGRRRRTAVWISLDVMVDRRL